MLKSAFFVVSITQIHGYFIINYLTMFWSIPTGTLLLWFVGQWVILCSEMTFCCWKTIVMSIIIKIRYDNDIYTFVV